MEDSWCRVSVSWAGTVTDLVLANGVAVGAVLPELVELIIDPSSRTAGDWRLSRPSGERLDEDMTLPENGVRDGDVLAISASPAPVFVRAAGHFGTVGAAAAPYARQCDTAAWAWCATVVTATLLGSVTSSGLATVAPVIAAGIAVTAAAVARRARTVRAATASGVVAMLCGAAAGYLAVGTTVTPAPGVLLAAAGVAAAAVALARLTIGDPVVLTAVGICATLLAVAFAPAALGVSGLTGSASMLCVTAVGVLGAAARLVIAMTGLDPGPPGRGDARITGRRARYARRVLTGIVTGAAAAAATGCALLAGGSAGRAAEPVLAAVVTGALLLRSRTPADSGCRAALIAGGLASATATSVLLLRWIPVQAGWLTAAAATAVAVMYTQRAAFGPSVARTVDIVEAVLLAAVIPAAGWCAGIFGTVRDLSLPW